MLAAGGLTVTTQFQTCLMVCGGVSCGMLAGCRSEPTHVSIGANYKMGMALQIETIGCLPASKRAAEVERLNAWNNEMAVVLEAAVRHGRGEGEHDDRTAHPFDPPPPVPAVPCVDANGNGIADYVELHAAWINRQLAMVK